jgi:hypothetical protein
VNDLNVTGRDDYIINKALLYAAHFIAGLAPEHRPLSDRSDMLKLLRARLGDAGYESSAAMSGRFLEDATGHPFDPEDYI